MSGCSQESSDSLWGAFRHSMSCYWGLHTSDRGFREARVTLVWKSSKYSDQTRSVRGISKLWILATRTSLCLTSRFLSEERRCPNTLLNGARCHHGVDQTTVNNGFRAQGGHCWYSLTALQWCTTVLSGSPFRCCDHSR